MQVHEVISRNRSGRRQDHQGTDPTARPAEAPAEVALDDVEAPSLPRLVRAAHVAALGVALLLVLVPAAVSLGQPWLVWVVDETAHFDGRVGGAAAVWWLPDLGEVLGRASPSTLPVWVMASAALLSTAAVSPRLHLARAALSTLAAGTAWSVRSSLSDAADRVATQPTPGELAWYDPSAHAALADPAVAWLPGGLALASAAALAAAVAGAALAAEALVSHETLRRRTGQPTVVSVTAATFGGLVGALADRVAPSVPGREERSAQ